MYCPLAQKSGGLGSDLSSESYYLGDLWQVTTSLGLSFLLCKMRVGDYMMGSEIPSSPKSMVL